MRRVIAAGFVLATPVLGLGYVWAVQEPSPAYLMATVARAAVSSVVKASGTVQPVVSVDVSSQLSGRIADVFVDFDSQVTVGQPIARLDQDIFAARVSEARAALMVARADLQLEQMAVQRTRTALANARTAREIAESQLGIVQAHQQEAEKELQRQASLARKGVVSDRDLDHARAGRDAGAAELRASAQQIEFKLQAITLAEADLHMAEAKVQNAEAVVQQRQAALEQAEFDLARTVVRAPIDGVIIKRDVNPGQTVAVSLDAKTMFTIANDLRSMVVLGKIDEADVGQLKVGQVARFTVDAYQDKTFIGSVLRIRKSPETVQNVVSYTAVISAPNPDLLLYPGMTALLRITVNDTGPILTIPNEALRFRPVGVATPRGAKQRSGAPSGPGQGTVWCLDQAGHPRPVVVTMGSNDDHRTELLAGPLREGQQVVVGAATPHGRSGPWGLHLGF